MLIRLRCVRSGLLWLLSIPSAAHAGALIVAQSNLYSNDSAAFLPIV